MSDRFDEAVADTIGLNRTDTRLLDLLDREGRLTAGQLADGSGLSAGATTTAVDRLEAAGYARRVRDTNDRRRIYVEATEQAERNGSRFYGEHAALAEDLRQRYTKEQIELLLEFVRRGREFNERRASELEAALERPDRRAARQDAQNARRAQPLDAFLTARPHRDTMRREDGSPPREGTGMKLRLTVVLCAAFMLILGVATASAGNGGNSANAHLCQKNGWTKLVGSDGTSFADQDSCVSYAARGGTLVAKSQSQLDCESFGGTFGNDDQLDTGALTIFWTCNGFAYVDDASLVSEEHVLEVDCRNDGGYALAGGTGGVADATCYLSAA